LKSFIKFSSKLIVTVIAVAAFVYFGAKYVIPRLEQKETRDKTENVTKDSRFHPVTKVVDGDTFETEIDGKKEKVRMLGIDTPEKFESNKLDKDAERTGNDKKTIKKLGELSSEYAKKLLAGKKVRLEIDPIGDEKDRYGRLLRYVYLEDGTFLNLKLVEDGYANAYTRFEISKKNEIVNAEKRARENKRGLWGDIEGLKYMDGD
jgi:micrococcal nuclease